MTIYNKKGESLDIVFRFARPDEAPQIIALLKKQHGAAGYYPKMYDEVYIKGLIKTEKLLVVIAELKDGMLAGIMGAKVDEPFPGNITFSMLVIRPSIRGFGLGKKLHAYLLQIIPIHAYTCIYGYCMTLDTISQKNHIEFGYHMTGLLLNDYFLDTTAEYLGGVTLPVKDNVLVACLPKTKENVGVLYIPPSYRDYIIGVYGSMGSIFSEGRGERPAGFPSIHSLIDIIGHHYGELLVQKAGDDFKDILEKMLEQYGGRENQSFNVYINLNDPGCPHACRLLEEAGFFFTGVHPLSGEYEYLLMHHSPSLPVPFDRIAVVPEFKERFDYIRHLYQEISHGQAD
jgi:GNAT superfamily N-acetyltransferase